MGRLWLERPRDAHAMRRRSTPRTCRSGSWTPTSTTTPETRGAAGVLSRGPQAARQANGRRPGGAKRGSGRHSSTCASLSSSARVVASRCAEEMCTRGDVHALDDVAWCAREKNVYFHVLKTKRHASHFHPESFIEQTKKCHFSFMEKTKVIYQKKRQGARKAAFRSH